MIPIIFGYRSKPTVEGAFKGKCVECKRPTIHAVVKIAKWFTLFFIPVIPFSNKLFVSCRVCGMQHELKGKDKEKINELIGKTAA